MPTLWPHVPSIAVETLGFFTDVRSTYNGEFRDSYSPAVQRLSYSFGYTAQEAARAEWLLRSDPDAQWYVPIWHDGTRVTSTISASATELTVETNAEYVDGGYLAIIKDDQNAEVVEIDSVGAGYVILATGVSATYAASALSPVTVAPVRRCLAPNGLGRQLRRGIVRHTIDFIGIDGEELDSNPFSQLGGYDVITDRPRIRESYDGGLAQASSLLESGFGAYSMYAEESYIRSRSMVAYSDDTAANRYRRRQWLHAVRGKDRPFWLPSWVDDLELTAAIDAADTDITVAEFATDDTQLVGAALYFREGGIEVSRVITACSTSAGEHTLTIAATGEDFTTAATVSLMSLCRFDADAFQIEHMITGDGYVSRMRAPVVEVAG